MFRYLLLLPDGEPNDPAVYVTGIPNWSVDEVIMLGNGERVRVIAIADQISDELVSSGLNGVFTVEPA